MPTNDSDSDTETVNPTSGDPKPEQTEQFKLAYEQLSDERAALPEDRVERINVDIPKTVNIVFGHMPQIRALSNEVKALPSFDAQMFEKIESYARSLSFAHMLYNAASQPIEYVPNLAAELATVRERLVADASALATRGFLDGSRLTELKGGPGYKNIAYDVGTRVAMMRAAWPRVAGKTAVSEGELTGAQVQAEKLLLAVAAREQQEIDVTTAGNQRQRAFTLLVTAYDEARRAATFLRWGRRFFQDFALHLQALVVTPQLRELRPLVARECTWRSLARVDVGPFHRFAQGRLG